MATYHDVALDDESDALLRLLGGLVKYMKWPDDLAGIGAVENGFDTANLDGQFTKDRDATKCVLVLRRFRHVKQARVGFQPPGSHAPAGNPPDVRIDVFARKGAYHASYGIKLLTYVGNVNPNPEAEEGLHANGFYQSASEHIATFLKEQWGPEWNHHR